MHGHNSSYYWAKQRAHEEKKRRVLQGLGQLHGRREQWTIKGWLWLIPGWATPVLISESDPALDLRVLTCVRETLHTRSPEPVAPSETQQRFRRVYTQAMQRERGLCEHTVPVTEPWEREGEG